MGKKLVSITKSKMRIGNESESLNTKGKQLAAGIINKKVLIGKKRVQRSLFAAKKKDTGIGPSSKKKKLFDSEEDDDNNDPEIGNDPVDPQPLKINEFYIKPGKHFGGRVGVHVKVDAIELLKSKLSEEQIVMFRQTCFGFLLEMDTFVIQNQLMHSLLLREVYHENDKELRLKINGTILRFGLKEFALVTGLNCIDTVDKNSISFEGESFLARCFDGVTSIARDALVQAMNFRMWATDEDAIRIAVLFVIHSYLLSDNKPNLVVPKLHIDLVDSWKFNEYPWGLEVFEKTIATLTHNFSGEKRKSFNSKVKKHMYRVLGFPIAFMAWFFECCPYIERNLTCPMKIQSKIPRILNWRVLDKEEKRLGWNKVLFDKSAKRLMLKNITPTSEEMAMLPIGDLFREENEGDKEEVDFEFVLKNNNDSDQPKEEDAPKRNTNSDIGKVYNKLDDVLKYFRDFDDRFGAMISDTRSDVDLVREECRVLAKVVDEISKKMDELKGEEGNKMASKGCVRCQHCNCKGKTVINESKKDISNDELVCFDKENVYGRRSKKNKPSGISSTIAINIAEKDVGVINTQADTNEMLEVEDQVEARIESQVKDKTVDGEEGGTSVLNLSNSADDISFWENVDWDKVEESVHSASKDPIFFQTEK